MWRVQNVLLVGALAAIALVGWLDFLSGPHFAFAVFYLIPVVGIAWRAGAERAAPIAVAAGAAHTAAEVAWHGIDFAGSWNGLAWTALFLVAAFGTARFRSAHARADALQDQVDELQQLQRRLARTDPLTSLGNRRAFIDALQQAEARNRRTGGSIAIARLDLDRFHDFNRACGRDQGDLALRGVATSLALAIRMGDLLARFDEDEFAILLYACEPQDATHVAHRLIEQVAEVGRAFPNAPLTASVGVACFTRPGPDAAEMMRLAAIAQRQARQAGGGRAMIRIAGRLAADIAGEAPALS